MPVGRLPPWVKISQRGGASGRGHAFGVDRDHDALGAEFLRRLADDLAVGDRRRIDRGLVRAGKQQIADVVGGTDPAADGERHEADLGRAPDHIEQDAAILMARCDVEEA